ncbi:hypothetical protein RB595_008263 [Gaeumannomyces hyphopodioides]
MEPKSLRSKLRNIKPSHAFHKLTDRLGSKVRTGSTEACQPRALTHAHDSTWGLDPESTGPSTSSSTRVSGVVAGDTPAPHPASTQQPLPLQAAPDLSIPLAPGDTAIFQSKNHESTGKPSGSVNQKQTQAGSNMVVKNHESNYLVEEKDQDPSDDNASYHSAPTEQAQQDEQLALQLENDLSPHLPNTAQLNQATAKPTSRRTRLRQRFRGSAGSAHQAGLTTSLSGWKECQELRQYGRQISVRCSKCTSDIYVGDHKVVRHTQDMMMNAQAPHDAISVKNVVHSSMFCQRCNSLTCVGCGEAVDRKAAAADEATSAWTEGHDKRFRVNWHCDQGRLFMIWLFSAGYDYKPPPPASPTSHRASLAGASYQRFSRLFSPFGLKSDTTATPGPAIAASPPSSLPSLLPTWDMLSPTPATPVAANADVDASGSSTSGVATATTEAAAVPTTPTDSSKGKSSMFWGSSIGFSSLKSGGLPEKGTGYGRHDSRTWTPTVVRSAKQEERERIQEQYLGCLAVLVPTTEREESRLDEISPRLVELMIRRSPLVPLCVDLLRSHAMDELAARSELYGALCALLTALARHSATAAMLSRRTRLYPEREQTVRASIHTLDRPAAAGAPPPATEYEETTSLRDLIGAFVAQCRLLLAHSLAHSDEFKSDEDVRMLELCDRMCRLAAVLEEQEAGLAAATAGESDNGSETSPPSSNSSGSGSNNKTNSNSGSSSSSAAISAAGTPNNATVLTTAEEEGRRHRAYQLWWEANRVNEIPEPEMLRFFSYHSEAVALANRTTPFPKGRMRKLIKDHMTLRSGLPEGVFIQLCVSRMDVYKVMIVGPRGTPYENGLFEFDLFCGADYPYQPPQLRFRTTGGGRVRFNPNLYDNGLVCLSLLGTWGEGQRWDPNSSTLLQVLVSIQAMVFCEEPYYNEPGHELHPKPNDSERENARMREMTLEYAMMSWLRGLCPAPAPPRLPIYKPLSLGKSPSGPSSGSGSGLSINLAVPALPPPSPSPSSSPGYTNKPGIWEDLVREHFRANAATVLRTARGWKGTANGDKIRGLVLELEKLLEEHKFL